MSKQSKSLTVAGKVKRTPSASLPQPYFSPEILTIRRMEAREWIKRYREKARLDGANEARYWWKLTIADIERIRGFDEAQLLLKLMAQEK